MDGCVENQHAIFEKPDYTMNHHLKPLFIQAKINGVGVNKVLMDGGATVNLLPQSLLSKIGLVDIDLKPHNVVLTNYEGTTGNSLGAVEMELIVGSVSRTTMFMVVPSKANFKKRIVELLKEYKNCFAWDYNEMSGLSREMVELKLPIRPDKKPVKQIPRRFAPQILSKIKGEIERLLKSRFIKTARYVDWLENIVPIKKKNGTIRVCIDFRDLNLATPKDEYPMLVAEMRVDSAAGFEYLSMLDGYSGYNQIFIAEEDVSKTAFRCPGALGCYEWLVMPFGLKNAGATYQRAMNSMFHDFIEKFMQVYIDDIVVKSSSEDDHLNQLRQSFERMRQYGLKMNPLKCAFGVFAGDFLGFVVHKKGIEINQNKTKAIMETKVPSTKKELQSLLGKINFLRRFISKLSGKVMSKTASARFYRSSKNRVSFRQGVMNLINF